MAYRRWFEDEVTDYIIDHFNTTKSEVFGEKGRNTKSSHAKKAIAYYFFTWREVKLHLIGKWFKRAHSSVKISINTFEDLASVDREFKAIKEYIDKKGKEFIQIDITDVIKEIENNDSPGHKKVYYILNNYIRRNK